MIRSLTRGVLLTLPAQFAQMLPKNPKGLDGSINFVQATPVYASLLVLSQVPGAPDDNRSA